MLTKNEDSRSLGGPVTQSLKSLRVSFLYSAKVSGNQELNKYIINPVICFEKWLAVI